MADVAKEVGEYRQKDLIDGRAFNSTRLEVTRGGQTSVFEKTKTKNKEGQDEEKWKQSAPTARDLDQTTVDNLISAITAARATSFVDSAAKTGLDKPELVIALTSDGGKRVEKVSLARSGTDGYGTPRRRGGRCKSGRCHDRQHHQIARGHQVGPALSEVEGPRTAPSTRRRSKRAADNTEEHGDVHDAADNTENTDHNGCGVRRPRAVGRLRGAHNHVRARTSPGLSRILQAATQTFTGGHATPR